LGWGRDVIREENTGFCNFLVGIIFEVICSKNNEKGGLY